MTDMDVSNLGDLRQLYADIDLLADDLQMDTVEGRAKFLYTAQSVFRASTSAHKRSAILRRAAVLARVDQHYLRMLWANPIKTAFR